ATCTMPPRARSRTPSSAPTWRTAASTLITVPASRCARTSGANTARTPRSCSASACSGNEIGVRALNELGSDPDLFYEGGDQLVDALGRLEVRRVPDAGKRAVFAARKSAGDRLAARFGRDEVFRAAGDVHLLAVAARVLGEAALREAMHRLAIALRSDAPLA